MTRAPRIPFPGYRSDVATPETDLLAFVMNGYGTGDFERSVASLAVGRKAQDCLKV